MIFHHKDAIQVFSVDVLHGVNSTYVPQQRLHLGMLYLMGNDNTDGDYMHTWNLKITRVNDVLTNWLC